MVVRLVNTIMGELCHCSCKALATIRFRAGSKTSIDSSGLYDDGPAQLFDAPVRRRPSPQARGINQLEAARGAVHVQRLKSPVMSDWQW